jgi:hypothetical protein
MTRCRVQGTCSIFQGYPCRHNHTTNVMTRQRQSILRRREAGLQTELAAAEKRLCEHVMRQDIISGYLSALCETGKKGTKKKKIELMPTRSHIESVTQSSIIRCKFEVQRPDRERKYRSVKGKQCAPTAYLKEGARSQPMSNSYQRTDESATVHSTTSLNLMHKYHVFPSLLNSKLVYHESCAI